MLKKLACVSLAASLLWCCISTLAESPRSCVFFAINAEGEKEDYIISTASDGAALYLLGSSCLYRYRPEAGEKEVIVDWDSIFTALNHGQSRKEWLADFAKSRIDCLVSGSEIYGINYEFGDLYRLNDHQFDKIAHVPEQDNHFPQSTGPVLEKEGNILYLFPADDENEMLLGAFSLADGTTSVTSLGKTLAISDGEGDAISVLRLDDAGQYEIAFYDTVSQTLTSKTKLGAYPPSGLCYSGNPQCVYYAQDGQVFSVDPANNVQQVARFPIGISDATWALHMLPGQVMAIVTDQGVLIHARDDTVVREPLHLYLNNEKWVPSFVATHPDIDVTVTGPNQVVPGDITAGFISGSTTFDILEIDASVLLAPLMEKGYIADLSSSRILLHERQQLHSAVQAAITKNGIQFAVPSELTVYAWSYDKARWDAYSPGNLPETFDDLLALCEQWLQAPVDGEVLLYPEQDFFSRLYSDTFFLYVSQYDTNHTPLSFDTAIFREIFTKLDALRLRYPRSEKGADEYASHTPIIFPFIPVLLGDHSYGIPFPAPALDARQVQAANASLSVYVVNARSEHQHAAVSFLEHVAQNRTPADERMLKPSINEPVEYTDFDEQYAASVDNIAYLKEQLVTAKGTEALQLQETISRLERLVATSDESRWYISAAEIAAYRTLTQRLSIPQTIFSRILHDEPAQAFYDAFSQYYSGKITLEQLIDRLESKLDMVYLESK